MVMLHKQQNNGNQLHRHTQLAQQKGGKQLVRIEQDQGCGVGHVCLHTLAGKQRQQPTQNLCGYFFLNNRVSKLQPTRTIGTALTKPCSKAKAENCLILAMSISLRNVGSAIVTNSMHISTSSSRVS